MTCPVDQCHPGGVCTGDPGSCPVAPDGTACNDGDPFTVGDACHAGTCAGASQCPQGFADCNGDPTDGCECKAIECTDDTEVAFLNDQASMFGSMFKNCHTVDGRLAVDPDYVRRFSQAGVAGWYILLDEVADGACQNNIGVCEVAVDEAAIVHEPLTTADLLTLPLKIPFVDGHGNKATVKVTFVIFNI